MKIVITSLKLFNIVCFSLKSKEFLTAKLQPALSKVKGLVSFLVQ